MISRILVLIVCLGLAACASSQTVREAPLEEGVVESFDRPYDQVAAGVIATLHDMNIKINSSEELPDRLEIMVSKPVDLFSWGEVGRVIVVKSPAPPTAVRVLWEKRYQAQITGTGQTEFSQDFFGRVASKLAQP